MRRAVELILPVMRLGSVHPGTGLAVTIEVIVPINGKDHVVLFTRDASGRKRGTWATHEPGQFAQSGYYKFLAAVLDAIGRAEGNHDLSFYRQVLMDLHGYVSAVADAALAEHDAARLAA
ncbi:hypothetical protein [Burkholderia gladioli]|uniref:hypothetical protein n=1 Tax=Burkholderia gladioli TaxID=28095 RepID=UPI00163EAB4D|nr:hypothetical protein [Burkholderia gladioli]